MSGEVEVGLGAEAVRLNRQDVVQKRRALRVIDRGDAPLTAAHRQPDLPLVFVVPSDADVSISVELPDMHILVDGLLLASHQDGVWVLFKGHSDEFIACRLFTDGELIFDVRLSA